MIGTIVNTCTITLGTIIGSIIRKGIKDEYKETLFNAMGLAATGLGINSIVKNMPNSNFPVLFIVSLAVGSLLGTIIDIDAAFQKLVKRFSGKGRLGEGLSTGILLYCIGTLSILGPINSALYGDHTFLFTNATLDLVTSCVLASAYGIGMIFAAAVLFVWQGSIFLLATYLGNFMSADLMTEISIVGGFLIFSSGISILGIKKFKTLNMLPCLLVPVIFFIIYGMIKPMIG
ncbi:MAG: DUF554 domain-containing protein [Eubacteriales bacterium]|nr:DUF554 domain-containing protein [Eubacteriales bacterium]